MNIIIDTREQKPLIFKGKQVERVFKRKLEFGDYSLEGFEDDIAVERKSAADLFGTLGKGHKRFKRELQRAKDAGVSHFVILVESPFMDIYLKKFENAHFTGMMGHVIVKICFTLKMRYGIDVVFVNNRKEASIYLYNLFLAFLKERGVIK